MARASPRGRLAVLLALAFVPWTVLLVAGRAVALVLPFGIVDLVVVPGGVRASVLSLPTLLRYGGGLPRNPELLPGSVALYAGALLSAVAGLVDREDPRLTGGLLALSGLASLGVAYSFLHRPAYTPIPAGAVLLLVASWWLYGPALRRTIAGVDGQ